MKEWIPACAGMTPLKRLIIGITGATGSIYGVALLKALKALPGWESHLVLSDAGRSFTLPPGLHNSSLASTESRSIGNNRLSRTTGVPPIQLTTESCTMVRLLFLVHGRYA